METLRAECERAATSSPRPTSVEAAKLIRKLRWIGMDSEAAALQALLRGAAPNDSVLAGPTDTD